MMRRPLRVAKNSLGPATYFDWDDGEKKATVETIQDVEPIIEANKREQASGKSTTRDKSFKKIASIPVIFMTQWMQQDGVNWFRLSKREQAAYLRRKLNDPQYKFLRTSGGRF